MNYAIDRITLDVHSSACQGTLRWKHGDTARRIVASFTENGKPWEFQSDCEISLYIKKPDGTVVWGHCINPDANNAGSVVHYDIIGDETVLPGKLECEFRVYSRSKLLTSPRFNVIVDETVYNEDAIYSENRETFLTESVNKMISATAEAKAVSNEVQTKLDNGEFDGKDGKDGTNGYTPIKGVDYFDGKNGIDGTKWFSGTTDVSGGGYPVYMIAGAVKGDYHLNVITGYICKAGEKYWEFLCNLKGKDGVVGKNGVDGKDGTDGKSAYEYAVEGGYDESEEAFYGDLANVGSAGGGASLSDELPLMNGEASPGVSEEVSRADHVHPTDTTRMPLDLGGLTSFRGALDNADRLPVRDSSTDETKSCAWSTILSAIKKYVDPIIAEKIEEAITNGIVEASYAVSDSNGIYYAFLPEGVEDDGVLVLQKDLEGYVPKSDKLTITGVDENGVTHTWTVYGVSV